MARPKKIEQRKKRIHVCFSNTEHEALFLQAKTRGINVSEMIRLDVLNVRPTKKVATPLREQLINGVSALQQIAQTVEALNGKFTNEALVMLRNEIIVAGQLISNGLKK
ncbi:plasmid mobilization protein [Dyadobacter psychrotolerans]|uniref:Mobilization protein n=1 Tax=Dyadobacter psychrotolerans TaxID=2541721 RepID=A0A4R5DTE9_9BACT|nr:hypothetical protein [Dyadobacter psychrotolerans]TDE17742.1 hypothetical protein E0F88_07575 [Dyadobacter psychrotolerans]